MYNERTTVSEMRIELAKGRLMRQGLAPVLYRRSGRALMVRIVQHDKEPYPTDSLALDWLGLS